MSDKEMYLECTCCNNGFHDRLVDQIAKFEGHIILHIVTPFRSFTPHMDAFLYFYRNFFVQNPILVNHSIVKNYIMF